MAKNSNSISEKIYARYEYLAKKYASKIFQYEQLSYEEEDLVQEFRIKIWTSIKSYGRRWAKYRRDEATRPVPIRYYLEAACSNKMRDFIKYIGRENYKTRIDEINYDYGIEEETNIKPEENKFIINGIDLLEGLEGKEKIIFSLFLKGYNKTFLNKVYYNTRKEKKRKNEIINSGDTPLGVNDVIEFQKLNLIKKHGNDLRQQTKVFSSYNLSED